MARSDHESGVRRGLRERRAAPRVELKAPVLVDSQRFWGAGSCRDVSVGGVSLRGGANCQVGDEVDVYFELPSGTAVETQARVVRRGREGELCLRFLDLSGGEREALRFYVRTKQFDHTQILVS